MDFTLRQLVALEAVARHGHFGRAAAELGLSQPTVSAEVRTVERRLGLVLLERTRAGVVPTAAGEALLPSVTSTLTHARALDRQARRLHESPSSLTLAASPSLINRLVPQLLRVLAANEQGAPPIPGLDRVEVVEVETGHVLSAVRDGLADVGIGHWVTADEVTSSANIGFDPLHVLTARGLLPSTGAARLSDLAGSSLLIWPREQAPEYYDAVLDVCHEHGVEPSITPIESRLSGAQSYLLHTGQAFSLVPGDFAAEAPASVSSAPLDPPAGVPLNLVWRGAATGIIEQLVHLLRDLHAHDHTHPGGEPCG